MYFTRFDKKRKGGKQKIVSLLLRSQISQFLVYYTLMFSVFFVQILSCLNFEGLFPTKLKAKAL